MFSYEKVTLGGGNYAVPRPHGVPNTLCQMFVEVRTPDKSTSLCTTSGVSVCINDALLPKTRMAGHSPVSSVRPTSFLLLHDPSFCGVTPTTTHAPQSGYDGKPPRVIVEVAAGQEGASGLSQCLSAHPRPAERTEQLKSDDM